MPIDLTDADKDAARFAWEVEARDESQNHDPAHTLNCLYAVYRAGLAEGIERAAQKCDEYDVPQRTYASENTDHYRGFRAGAVRCAAEIRGLLK